MLKLEKADSDERRSKEFSDILTAGHTHIMIPNLGDKLQSMLRHRIETDDYLVVKRNFEPDDQNPVEKNFDTEITDLGLKQLESGETIVGRPQDGLLPSLEKVSIKVDPGYSRRDA